MRVTVSWSGGKDSAFALYKILHTAGYEVVSLHTVFGKDTKRVGLHGVREELIEDQADRLDIPLTKLYLDTTDNHDAYLALMRSYYQGCRQQGLNGVVFGDIFLEDLKAFREELLQSSGLVPIFPLWKEDSSTLVQDFIQKGFKTIICSADALLFTREVPGKTIDSSFIPSLPDGVDPCGENGEFHTFVYDGPLFRSPVMIDFGEKVKRAYSYNVVNEDGSTKACESSFWFQDLLPRIAVR